MSLPPPDLHPDESAALAARTAARAAAAGLAAAFATVDSPLGPLVAVVTRRGLARVAYAADGGLDAVLDDLARRLTPALVEAPARLDGVRRAIEEYFAGRRRDLAAAPASGAPGLALDWSLAGGGFRRRVLERCARIPYGATSTYREVAAAAGSPRAFRAAGNALGANPLPIVVPCHRVVASGGGLGGYTGGLDRKRALLALERSGRG